MTSPITSQIVRVALAKTRSNHLLDAPGWESYFGKWAQGLNDFIEWYHRIFREYPDPVGLLALLQQKARPSGSWTRCAYRAL